MSRAEPIARHRILVVGDLMIVTLGGVERMPEPGENVVLRDASVHVSGVGANVALDLVALGVDVTLVSAVGEDALGDRIVSELRAGGVDTAGVMCVPGATTGSMVVMVEPDGERTMVGTRGASEQFEFDPLALLAGQAAAPSWVHVSGYVLLDERMAGRCEALLAGAIARGIPCSVDLEGGRAGSLSTALDRVVVLGNAAECEACFGTSEPAALAAARANATEALVVKAGADGCVLIDASVITCVPAAGRASGGDSTGAGDAFDAAFIAARLRGASLEAACATGNRAGALAAVARGPRPKWIGAIDTAPDPGDLVPAPRPEP